MVKPRRSLRKWIPLIPLVIAIVASLAYLAESRRIYGLGFPLDDAWIHQTYARNLGLGGEWAFRPGEASAGSTSPLWTAMLAVGYLLGINPLLWTYVLGTSLLATAGWIGARWLGLRMRGPTPWVWAVAVLICVEWHLVWSAVSGMEILAESVLILAVFWLMEAKPEKRFFLGILIGLGVWIRPDALSLLLAASWHVLLLGNESRAVRIRGVVILGLGFLLAFLPYLAFNYMLSGTIWPSTFYAKPAEYAALRQSSYLSRLLSQLRLPLVGVGAVLLPGVVLSVVEAVRRRLWPRLAAVLWVIAYLGLYAFQLPVGYQHGRYAMPTVAVLLVVGLEGLMGWARPRANSMAIRVLSGAWIASTAVVAAAFWVVGMTAYARDVAIIETEMVAAARWVAKEIPAEAVVAAHDIGALGYYGEREILDLAGLVSPEVIPIVRNEPALADYLDRQGADYLITFPGWYAELIEGRQVIFSTKGGFSPAQGGENMHVYQWRNQPVVP